MNYEICISMILATAINSLMVSITSNKFFSLYQLYILIKNFFVKKDDTISQITIYATKGIMYGGHCFSFPIEYKAIIHKLLQNNINIRKMTKPINKWGDNDILNFYIDADENINSSYHIEKDICVAFSKSYDKGGKDDPPIENLKIIVNSKKYSTTELNQKIKEWIFKYKDETETYKDDGKIYYFSLKDKPKYASSEATIKDDKKNEKNESVDIQKDNSNWKRNILISYKTFKNTFFNDKDICLKKLNYFLKNEDLYKKRGIPYNLGILMYGEPGCGKTSCIKAISNLTKRHVVEVNLKKIKTCGDFEKIFNDNNMDGSYIPHDKKIVVLEDIDCMINIVQSRKENVDYDEILNVENDMAKFILIQEKMAQSGKYERDDKLTLSCILNTIDGVLENYGRILIMTTNYPDRLDDALIRPGRIDMKINFTKCTNKMCHDIINNFYEIETENENDNENKVKNDIIFPDNKYTPAEVLEICSLNYDDIQKTIKILQLN
jgi:hypothetical protein